MKQFSSQIIVYYYKNTICNVFYSYNGIIWWTEVLIFPNLSKFSFIVCTHGSFKMHPLLLNKHIFHYHVPKNTCIYVILTIYIYVHTYTHIWTFNKIENVMYMQFCVLPLSKNLIISDCITFHLHLPFPMLFVHDCYFVYLLQSLCISDYFMRQYS